MSDVPVSITAFNEETMENMALRDLEDIAAYSSTVESLPAVSGWKLVHVSPDCPGWLSAAAGGLERHG